MVKSNASGEVCQGFLCREAAAGNSELSLSQARLRRSEAYDQDTTMD